VFCGYVAAVKCRHVLHYCVVIFFWSSGIMDFKLFSFKKWSSAQALEASTMLSFFITIDEQLKAEAAIVPYRLCSSSGYPFSDLRAAKARNCLRFLHFFRQKVTRF